MNIDKLTGGVGGGGRTRESKPVTPAKDSPLQAQPETKGAEVKLSAQSKSIQQIEAEVSKMPDIDDAAIDRIKNALANNEYKIDYNRLAGKMMKFEGFLN
jgi:negative regulator of flagellin synthesis FlgM